MGLSCHGGAQLLLFLIQSSLSQIANGTGRVSWILSITVLIMLQMRFCGTDCVARSDIAEDELIGATRDHSRRYLNSYVVLLL